MTPACPGLPWQQLADLGIVRELTGKERHRLFVYTDYLTILNEGAMPTG